MTRASGGRDPQLEITRRGEDDLNLDVVCVQVPRCCIQAEAGGTVELDRRRWVEAETLSLAWEDEEALGQREAEIAIAVEVGQCRVERGAGDERQNRLGDIADAG